MNTAISCASAQGKIKAIASKSVAHRMLICAAFADAPTRILCEETNNDIEATTECLSALGAKVERNAPYYDVTPISPAQASKNALLPCRESGSTLRFLLPVVSALGSEATFLLEGRLPERPLSPLREELETRGITISGKSELKVSGSLVGNEFSIDGSISSQFVSGLLFALTLLGGGKLTVCGKLESAPYVDMTVDALSLFGVKITKENNVYTVSPIQKLVSPSLVEVEGDWSNAAFILAFGVLSGDVEIYGLSSASLQGDSAVIDILREFGADITYCEQTRSYRAKRSALHGIEIDASQIPDLVPILATVASVANGKTLIYGASRLKLKESDRLKSTCAALSTLGAQISYTDDSLIVEGRERLSGGVADSAGDHRIAMSVAVASSVCEHEVTLKNSQAVNKSYPRFWLDASELGITIDHFE